MDGSPPVAREITGETMIEVTGLSAAEEYPQSKFKIVASGNGTELNMFAKVTELNHNKWNNIRIKPYKTERIFYSYLMGVYRELEDKHQVAVEDMLHVPLFYGAETGDQREILILEDAWPVGFDSHDRIEPVDWPYAAAAVTELAKLHALSIAFQQEYPNEFERISRQLPRGLIEKNEESSALFESFKSFTLQVVRDENKDKLESFLKRHDLTSFNNMLRPLNRKVIIHGHFWPKNMMHRVLKNGSVEVIPIDFTSVQVGSPATDLLHFLFTASDDPFREKHYQELIQHYLTQLHQAAARLGVDLTQKYTLHALEHEITEKLPYGLLSAVMYLPVLALDDREDRYRERSDGDARAAAAADMYSIRLNQAVDAYANTTIFEYQPSSWNVFSWFETITEMTSGFFFNSDKEKND